MERGNAQSARHNGLRPIKFAPTIRRCNEQGNCLHSLERSGRIVNCINEVTSGQGKWEKITVTVDSRAVDSVGPANMANGIKIAVLFQWKAKGTFPGGRDAFPMVGEMCFRCVLDVFSMCFRSEMCFRCVFDVFSMRCTCSMLVSCVFDVCCCCFLVLVSFLWS